MSNRLKTGAHGPCLGTRTHRIAFSLPDTDVSLFLGVHGSHSLLLCSQARAARTDPSGARWSFLGLLPSLSTADKLWPPLYPFAFFPEGSLLPCTLNTPGCPPSNGKRWNRIVFCVLLNRTCAGSCKIQLFLFCNTIHLEMILGPQKCQSFSCSRGFALAVPTAYTFFVSLAQSSCSRSPCKPHFSLEPHSGCLMFPEHTSHISGPGMYPHAV